ncbi:hypothetical protein PF003_g31080 [Phytophthora fragariae]|nr:hypothetical protein PF003_g31080 [Phytophthora fragariae]
MRRLSRSAACASVAAAYSRAKVPPSRRIRIQNSPPFVLIQKSCHIRLTAKK